ncbi:hypothetical protein DM01DRAFT_1335868 [Hesseltinella vesiculosa]|uniref:Mitochondrial adapter protein MCP1 transmembrane domain-containing protein n=1 Tax=Hesseltinella vesiculosa TaxID=101127 RepID=A0A1X2GHP3_9FUNG|nr:hypothetical protein DM01DRAFT_1335868 [Hesseltinella vesiculosa]
MDSKDKDVVSRQTGYKLYGYATKAQAISAIGFTAFISLHGMNVATGIFGADTANRVLELLRPLYQNKISEDLIAISLGVHLLSGLAKTVIKHVYKLTIETKAPAKYHYISGGLLAPLVGVHFNLVRGTPREWHVPGFSTDFGIVAWGLQYRPLVTWSIHGSLAAIASYHIIYGAPVAFQRAFPSFKVPSFLKGSTANVLVATSLLLAGIYGISKLDFIPMANEYSAIYTKVLRF